MHDFTELDRNIDLNKSQNYHLSIQLAPDGFSFCLLETYIGRYVGFKHYHFKKQLHFDVYLEKINHVLSTEPLLQHDYASVSLMIVSEKAILIPEELFKPEDVKVYFDLNENLEDLEEIHFNFISSFGVYNVFSIHHELLNLFRCKFAEINIYHQWAPLLCMPELDDLVGGTKMYINFNGDVFDLLIVKDKKLILCNSYQYKNENDFVFYLLNAIKQLKIELHDCVIKIIGNTLDKGKYFELLSRFVDDFEIGKMSDEFSFSPGLKNVTKPIFYNLYNLYRCVSLEENSEE